VAIFSNSASGASLFTGTWGRAPGARCRYALKMGARCSAGTSSQWTSSRPCLWNTALPPAARTLWTHCTFSPSIDTRYRCPLTTVTAIGSETVRPDVRPVTSKVTIESGRRPEEKRAAHARLSILAIQLGRCPRYNHLLKSPRVIESLTPFSLLHV
jgi:hypothetical protein